MVRLTVTSAGVFGIPCERGVLEFGYDKLHDQFSKAVWDGKIKAMKFEAISAPGLTKFSNPSACKSYLAYWGMNESKGKSGNEIKAVVFDLNGGKAINQEDLGYSDFATDNLGYFKTPRWAEDAKLVEFNPPPSETKLKKTSIRPR
ncbi:MAG: hypothetical protein KBD76_12480 [Bacteriovorax sp.]|nr:hypothetical protein [Bacteriovorax sp.]